MRTAKDYIDARCRLIAKMDGQNPETAVLSMRAVSVVGQVLAAANGETNSITIVDSNVAGAVPGNRFRLESQGSQKYAVVSMIADATAGTDPGWGIKNFVFNDNPIDKLSFQESLQDRSNNAAFFSLEAVKSGIDPFPWQFLPAFGPNDTLDIVAYNNVTPAADADCSAQFWLLPVSGKYAEWSSGAFNCKPDGTGIPRPQ